MYNFIWSFQLFITLYQVPADIKMAHQSSIFTSDNIFRLFPNTTLPVHFFILKNLSELLYFYITIYSLGLSDIKTSWVFCGYVSRLHFYNFHHPRLIFRYYQKKHSFIIFTYVLILFLININQKNDNQKHIWYDLPDFCKIVKNTYF